MHHGPLSPPVVSSTNHQFIMTMFRLRIILSRHHNHHQNFRALSKFYEVDAAALNIWNQTKFIIKIIIIHHSNHNHQHVFNILHDNHLPLDGRLCYNWIKLNQFISVAGFCIKFSQMINWLPSLSLRWPIDPWPLYKVDPVMILTYKV